MADSVVGRLIYKITGDLSDIKQSLTNTEKRIKNFSKLVQSAAGLFGVVTAFKSLINIARGSVDAFMEQEEASTKLSAALKTSGEYSGVTRKRMEALSSSLQQVTRYGDETTSSAMALLMSLGGMSSKMAMDIIPNVQDFATALGMDLDSAATLVSKAIEGNVGALSRYGIKIEEGLDKQGRMAAITEALSEKFGGLAVAMGDTAGGALVKLQNAFGDMKEEVGRATVTSLQPLVSWLAQVATKITGVMQASNDLKDAIRAIEGGFADTSDLLIKARADWAEARQALDDYNASVAEMEYQTGGASRADEEWQKTVAANIKTLNERIIVARRAVTVLEGQAGREAKAAEAAAARARAEQEYQDKVAEAYGKTDEAQRIALENDIRYWESALLTAGVSKSKIVAILEDLRAEYAKKFPAARVDTGYYDTKMRQMMKLENQQEAIADADLQRAKETADAVEAIDDEKLERDRMRIEKLQAYKNEGERLSDQSRDRELEKEEKFQEDLQRIRRESWNYAIGLLDALADLQSANLDHQLAELEAEQKRELEAFQGTAEERAALVKEYEEEKAKLEYESALKSWKMQLAAAIVSGARSVLSSYQELGWPLGLIPAGLMAAISGLQLAAIRAAKPVPSFSTGADFTVPAGYPNDSYPMNVESGEHVTVTPAGQGGEPLHIVVNLDGRPILDTVARASRDRRLLIDARSVVP
ncbi:MAG: hypothetical protein WC483_06050 [Candidatus Paceibacterota bacterium]